MDIEKISEAFGGVPVVVLMAQDGRVQAGPVKVVVPTQVPRTTLVPVVGQDDDGEKWVQDPRVPRRCGVTGCQTCPPVTGQGRQGVSKRQKYRHAVYYSQYENGFAHFKLHDLSK